MKSKNLGILVAALAILPIASHAAPITFNFSGTVTSIDDPLNAFAGVVAGTTFSGSYTFESTTPDAAPGDPTDGRYAGAITAFSLTIGGHSLFGPGDDLSPNQIRVRDNTGATGNIDSYNVLADLQNYGGYSDIDVLRLGGQGPNTVFGSDALPLTPDFFASLAVTFFRLVLYEGSGPTKVQAGLIDGTLTSMTTTTSVPEPSTLGMLGLAMIGLALMRRRYARA
jgi:hypothetical protein